MARRTHARDSFDVWFAQPARKSDGWEVRRKGAARASKRFNNQKPAWKHARKLAKNYGDASGPQTGQAILKGRDGTIRRDHTFPVGNDPHNIPG